MRVCIRIVGWSYRLSYEESSLSTKEGRKYFDDKSRKQRVPLQKNHEIGKEKQNFHEAKLSVLESNLQTISFPLLTQ